MESLPRELRAELSTMTPLLGNPSTMVRPRMSGKATVGVRRESQQTAVTGWSRTSCGAARLLICGMFLSRATASLAGQTPKTSAGPARRSVLVYTGGPGRPGYSIDDFVHTVSFVDTAGRANAWLCDGAIFLEYHAPSGRYMMPWTEGYLPSTGDDWVTYLDSVFAVTGPVARLDSAVGTVTSTVGGIASPFSLTVMIPYPDPRSDTLRFGGRLYHFRVDRDRATAVDSYVSEVKSRIGGLHLRYLTFTGMYWLREGIPSTDSALVTLVSASLHRQSLQFVWIPAWGAAGAEKWRLFGFDQAAQQANYFFHWDVPVTRLDSALASARAAQMGLEIEFDRRMFGPNWEYWDRLEPYLSAVASAPDFRAKPIVIYDGAGALMQLARSRDAWERALYERLAAVLRAPATSSPAR